MNNINLNKSIIDKILKASELLSKENRKGNADYVITSSKTANLINEAYNEIKSLNRKNKINKIINEIQNSNS